MSFNRKEQQNILAVEEIVEVEEQWEAFQLGSYEFGLQDMADQSPNPTLSLISCVP
jgi:hypothetical protein